MIEHLPGRRNDSPKKARLREEPVPVLLDTLKLEAVDVTEDPLELPEDSKSLSDLLAAALQQQAGVYILENPPPSAIEDFI
jgi:hypothetical protein